MQKDIRKPVATSSTRYSMVDHDKAGDGFKKYFDYQRRMLGRILWTGKDTICRIVPGNNGSDIYPQVVNASSWTTDADMTEFLSDTFYMTQTLSGFGDNKLDICANLRPDSDEAALYPESPLSYFCNKIHRTMRYVRQGKGTNVKVNDKWHMWTGMQGTLPYPKTTLLFQAIVTHLSGRDCRKEGEDSEEAPLYGILGINHKDSIMAFLSALVQPMDRRKPIGTDNNTYGAFAELKGNVLFLNSYTDPEGKKMLKPSIQAADAPASSWEPQEQNLSEKLCKDIWVPWEKALKYLTIKEQLELLASEFGADTVNYVFSLDRNWSTLEIPERIASVGIGSYGNTRVSMSTTPKVTVKESIPSSEVAELASVVDKIKNGSKPSKGDLASSLLDDIELEVDSEDEGVFTVK